MSTYTVSTYQYTDTDNVAGFTLANPGTSLFVSVSGSIVTGGDLSDGIDLQAAQDSLVISGLVQSKAGEGIDVTGDHSVLAINGSVEGYTAGIYVGDLAVNTSITIKGTVSSDTATGLDLVAAYSSATISGHVSGYDYGVLVGGDHDGVTVSTTGHVDHGLYVDGNSGTIGVAGTAANGAGDGVHIDGDHVQLTVSGHASGLDGVSMFGGYGIAKITGTVESTSSSAYDAALYVSGGYNTATIGPHGSVSGYRAVGIEYGLGDTVTNNGDVSGLLGLEVYRSANSTIINHGTVEGGVYVDESAAVTIVNSGTIADTYGFYVNLSTLTVVNSGTIHGDLYAVDHGLGPVGYIPGVTIDNSGTWRATEIYASNQDFTLVNSGTIRFNHSYGGGHDVYTGITAGGVVGTISIVNEAGGSISGVSGAIMSLEGYATVDNAGVLSMTTYMGGTLTNEVTGSIAGHVTIYDGTLNNYGAMHGTVTMANDSGMVDNYGTIYGNLVFETVNASVLVNDGTITGHVTGGIGNDSFNGSGGAAADWFNGATGNDSLSGGSADDQLFGAGGNDIVIGGNGDDALDGGSGHDILVGGNGDDTLAGGAGPDQFAFGAHFGKDVIADFTPGAGAGHDFIHLVRTGFATFADVQAAMSVNGDGNAVITLDANDTITLVGVHDTVDLVAANFSIV